MRKRKEREEQEMERVRLKVRRKEAVASFQALLVERIKDPQVYMHAPLDDTRLENNYYFKLCLSIGIVPLRSIVISFSFVSLLNDLFYFILSAIEPG